MTARVHAEAIVDLVEATGVRVYEGVRPDDSALPCAVLFISNGTGSRTTLAPRSDRLTTTVQVTSVGLDAGGVRSVAERVRGALLDTRPDLPGRRAWPITQTTADVLRIDRDVTPHLLYTVDVYDLSSVISTPAEPGPFVEVFTANHT